MAARDAPEPADRADPPGAHRLAVEEPGQVVGQGRGGRVTVGGTLGQGLQDDGLEVPRDPPIDQPGRRGLAAADLIEQLGRGVAVERRPERQQLVERGPQAVDVGPPVDGPRARLLGAHVPRRAQQAVVMGQAGIGEPPRQAEVGHPDRSLRVDQQVGGLDVAMDHPVMVGVRQRLGRLEADLGDPAKIGRSARRIEGGRRGLVITGAGQRGPGARARPEERPGRLRAAVPVRYSGSVLIQSPVESFPVSTDLSAGCTCRRCDCAGRRPTPTRLGDRIACPAPRAAIGRGMSRRRRVSVLTAAARMCRGWRQGRFSETRIQSRLNRELTCELEVGLGAAGRLGSGSCARRTRRSGEAGFAGGGGPLDPGRSPRFAAWRSSTARRPGRRRRPARYGCGAAPRRCAPRSGTVAGPRSRGRRGCPGP